MNDRLNRQRLHDFLARGRAAQDAVDAATMKAADPMKQVALTYTVDVIKRAYEAAAAIHERAGQRHATMLVLAAWIVDIHSRMVGCPPEETLTIVRGCIDDLRQKAP